MTNNPVPEDFILPSLAIAEVKYKLFEGLLERCVKHVKRKLRRNLDADETDSLAKLIETFVAEMPPDLFGFPPSWEPRSNEEIKETLTQLKSDPMFNAAIEKYVIQRIRSHQSELRDFY